MHPIQSLLITSRGCQEIEWLKWLQIFPSYGFLLTADQEECEDIIELFASQDIDCAVIGEVTDSGKIETQLQAEQHIFWDFQQESFTGLNYQQMLKQCDFLPPLTGNDVQQQIQEQPTCQA